MIEKEKKKPDLVISRIPANTKEKFIELANRDFCGDYGMTLKECFDKREEYFKQKEITNDLILKVNNLEAAIKGMKKR